MHLDPKALKAARVAAGKASEEGNSITEAAIRAYLSASIPAEIGELVERLEKYISRATQDFDGRDEWFREAASALRSLSARVGELEQALSDLVSWLPEKPAEPKWEFKAGEYGADDAVACARAVLSKGGNGNV